ncbi:MAG: tyrosine-type recombinase/integrase [Methanofastidiosum sp.]|jgi:integrase|nr:tyrosine-type recombinase/integrase [Methanofastidiosum sp.]
MSIYNEKRLFEREICLIEKSSMNEENKKIILEYKSYLIATRIGILRAVRYIMVLRLISEKFNNKTFSDWTKKDVIEVLEKIEITEYSPHTKREYDKILKKFFKWHKGKDWEGFECIKGNRKIDRKPDILSKDEVLAVIKAARHPRNRAMVALLYEGGFRIGELASIKCKDIEFNSYGSKTGERLVPFVMSESYLKV